jgi:hypothetical protein
MKNWIQRNVKNIIVTAFVVPILLVAFVSISHVTSFYGISNPVTWAIYLSVGIEIAALSALAAVSVNMGRFVYLPFFIVTLIQMVGNIFFSFSYIDENGQQFKDWVEMVGVLFENMGVDRTDYSTHKTIISFISGGLLPIISLTFAHMLVKFSENKEEETNLTQPMIVDLPEMIAKKEEEDFKVKFNPTQEQLDLLENLLTKKYKGPEQITPTDEPYRPSDEELMKLQDILGLKENIQESKLKFNVEENIKEEDSILTEEPLQEELQAIEEIPQVIEKIPQEELQVIEEVKNEIPELIQEPQIIINETPIIEEDKKKTDEESEFDVDYKVLNYTKRNG